MRRRNRPQRLERLEARLCLRTTGIDTSDVDWRRLTMEGQQDLVRLAGKTRRLPTGRWDFSALDDADLERLRELIRAVRRSGDEWQLRGRMAPSTLAMHTTGELRSW